MRRTLLCATLLLTACPRRSGPSSPAPGTSGSVVESSVYERVVPRSAAHAWGRPGDLVLSDQQGTRLTIAKSPTSPGHRPLVGALLDADLTEEDLPDPLLWWQLGVVDAEGRLTTAPASLVEVRRCENGTMGVYSEHVIEARRVRLQRTLCALSRGEFSIKVQPVGEFPAELQLAYEFNIGTSQALIANQGERWEGEQLATDFLALSEGSKSLVFRTPNARAKRRFVRIAREVFPAPVVFQFSERTLEHSVWVGRGDVFDALGHANVPMRSLQLTAPQGRTLTVDLLDAEGNPLARGAVPFQGTRGFSLPIRIGATLRARDEHGLVSLLSVPARTDERELRPVPPAARGQLNLRYSSGTSRDFAVRVLLTGLDGTPDPLPAMALPNAASHRSVYLREGSGTVFLAPGRYRVVATHGPAYALSVREVSIADGATVELTDELARVLTNEAWIPADFHLHAEPSPDAPVTLRERVLSLLCSGVEFAVATDHNRITDYSSVMDPRDQAQLFVQRGNEITTTAPTLGHFNAFPLPPVEGAPEDAISAYYAQTPTSLFAAARASGAEVLQVNHARMPPSIGYFDLTNFDSANGNANNQFSRAFDALEAHNGVWLESPERVREGAVDLVGLARAGIQVAATGNSDSHQLFYEEAGWPRTWVHVVPGPRDTLAQRVYAALRQRHTQASSGAFIEARTPDNKEPGDLVRVPANGVLRIHVEVRAPSWIPVDQVEVWLNDQPAQTISLRGRTPAENGTLRYVGDVELRPTNDAVALVWASSEQPIPHVLAGDNARAIAFTSLFYIDRDGDGSVRVPPRSPAAPNGIAR